MHDKRVLADLGEASATLGWCVGDSHTHIVILGLHPDENDVIDYLSKLSRNDKLYKIVLTGKEDFKLTQLDNSQFLELKLTKVPFSKQGDALNFRLFKDQKPIFDIAITVTGGYQTRKFSIEYQPLTTTSLVFDKVAAEYWAFNSIKTYTNSLFYSVKEQVWLPALNLINILEINHVC